MRSGAKTLLAFAFLVGSAGVQAADLWQDISLSQRSAASADSSIRYYRADDTALRLSLLQAPHERVGDLSHHVQLPMPDGSLTSFSVVESPIMAPGLAAKYPEIKTFKVIGIDDKHASGRIDISPLGFHGMIDTSKGTVYIDPQDFRTQSIDHRSRRDGADSRPTPQVL